MSTPTTSPEKHTRGTDMSLLPDWTTERTFPVVNPYTGEEIARLPICGPDEVDQACKRAAAMLAPGSFPQFERARVLDRVAVLLEENLEDLARVITAETGKTIREARHEVRRGAETFRFSASEARHLSGELVPLEATFSGTGKLGMCLRVPLGVVGAITPFNFPLNTVAHKIGPAIAAGCPVVLKPAPETPVTAIKVVELLREAGMPADWIVVVTDDESEAGAALVRHETPQLITFTGSSEVGWSIAATAARKRVVLELGSNAPVIIEPDANLELAAKKIVAAAFGTTGQSCISVQRVIVHRSVHDRLGEMLAAAASALVVGDPMDDATDMGPLITPEATSRVSEWIGSATSTGGSLLAGGQLEGGCLRPTVVDEPARSSKLRTQEIFGPVLALIAYDDFDEALSIAMETTLRLQAGIFTGDLNKALRAVRELDFGGVLVNEIPTYRADHQPYGGVRDAGNTREGPAHAVLEMTQLRFVSLEAQGLLP
jgi:acyl-CoA reductase-like NAD-dependent aldehyde dehydrogenase